MKNLALLAAVAAIAIPASSALAASDYDETWYEDATQLNIAVQDGQFYNGAPFIPAEGQTMVMDLEKGGQLMLDGEAAYIIDENGNKFLANNAPHTTASGITYTTEDGIALYARPEFETYVMNADIQDENGDGVIDDVEFSIK